MWRKFEERIIDWKNRGAEKPLMVVGARQIGKTYTIRKVAKETFDQVIEFNLEADKDIFDAFELTIKPEEIIEEIQIRKNLNIDVENTLLFFDEVQVSERLITSLKYFNESQVPYKIICAGSLLGVKLNRFQSSFPVGKVEILNLFPMDFEEFLVARKRENLRAAIEKSYLADKALSNGVHEQALKMYREYLYVGGMPEAVKDFIAKDETASQFNREILTNIDLTYTADMMKYIISAQEGAKNERLYNSVVSQLSQPLTKKFKYALIEKGGSKRKFSSSIDWLVASRIVLSCHLLNPPQIPLGAHANPNYFKIYLSDVGLLSYKAQLQLRDILETTPNFFSGALAENYVAQQFSAMRIPIYYWAKNEWKAEVDFVIDGKDGVIPVEVKAGTNVKASSMNIFMTHYSPKYAIRISAKNFGFENNIKSVPLYAVWCMKHEEAER